MCHPEERSDEGSREGKEIEPQRAQRKRKKEMT
jgi:hypothetical protein